MAWKQPTEFLPTCNLHMTRHYTPTLPILLSENQEREAPLLYAGHNEHKVA